MTLSTGAVIVETPIANGATLATVIGRASGEMTEAEWEEYCRIRRTDVPKAPR
jgi:hypothetical protein